MRTPDPRDPHPPGGAEPDIPTVSLVGVILALLVVISIFGVEAAYYVLAAREHEVKVENTVNPDLAAYRDEQAKKLGEYRWVDRAKGVAAIPIERAMELEAAAHASASPRAAASDSAAAARPRERRAR